MVSDQPVAVDVDLPVLERMMDRENVLDGIIGIGHTWNILSIKYEGNTRLQVDDIISIQTPSYYKGMVELQMYEKVLDLKLARIGSLHLCLLMCTMETKQLTKPQLAKIRKLVIKAIRKSIKRLPDISISKRDYVFRFDDQLAIHDQKDWEQVGAFLSDEILLVELDKLSESDVILRDFWKNMKIYFAFKEMGQEMEIQKDVLMELRMDGGYSSIRSENVLRLVVHCAMDYRANSEVKKKYLIVPNSEYIASRLPGTQQDYYCPFLCLPGLGNLRYSFKDGSEGNIFGCQVYIRWTNYMKHHRYKLFREPYIAKRLVELSQLRFEFEIEKGQEIYKKVRLDKDKKILSPSVPLMVKDITNFLDAGLEVRVEVIYSKCPSTKLEIENIIENAFKEVEVWLKNKKLSFLDQRYFLSNLDKSSVKKWAEDHIVPCINTLERFQEKTKQATTAKNILNVLTTSFWSAQDYLDAIAAETILSFFLNGMLNDMPKALDNSKFPKARFLKKFFGFNIKNKVEPFSLKNVQFKNGYLKCLNLEGNKVIEELIPEWISRPELQFLREIVGAVHKLVPNPALNHNPTNGQNEEWLCRSMVGFAIAFEESIVKKRGNIMFTEHTLDLKTNYIKSCLLGTIRKDVMAVNSLIENLFSSGSFGKNVVSYVFQEVDAKMKTSKPNWNMTNTMVNFLEKEIFITGFPIVLSVPGGNFTAGFPYNAITYPTAEYMSVLKNTYLWYRGIDMAYNLKTEELAYLSKLHTFLGSMDSNTRSEVGINVLMDITALVLDGKIQQARNMVKTLQNSVEMSEIARMNFFYLLEYQN